MTLAIPIRDRNNASQANCFGFCTCTPSFRREEATPLLSADTKLPRICTFSSYFKSRIFNGRPAHRASFRLTPFVSADAKCRGGGRYSFLKSKCVALIPPSRYALCHLSPSPSLTRHSPPATRASLAPRAKPRGHRSPDPGRRSRPGRDCLCNSFGLHTSESRFRNSFSLHTYVQWGGYPLSKQEHFPLCSPPSSKFSLPSYAFPRRVSAINRFACPVRARGRTPIAVLCCFIARGGECGRAE